MRVVWGLLIVAAVGSASGCRVFDRLRDKDRDRPSADPASRTRDRDRDADDPSRPPRNWLDNPAAPDRDKPARTPGRTAADPREAGFNARAAGRRIISGVLEDADGRRVGNAYVAIEPADPGAARAGAEVGVTTDADGYFVFPGLAAGKTYALTARVKDGTRPLSGRQYVRVPNERVRLVVKEDLSFVPVRPPAGDLPPGGVPSPGGGVLPVPSLFDGPGAKDAGGGTLPFPRENSGGDGSWPAVSPPPAPPPRPDLVAPLGKTWNDPPVSIPGPAAGLPPPKLSGSTSRSGPAGEFVLVSAAGRERAFPAGASGDLVLLDFMTTTCGPCQRAVPALVALQERYERRGLEVVGVVCDPVAPARRRELAAAYQDDHRLNYGLYAEAGEVGPLLDAYRVDRYPTLVLTDGTGRALWRGHPKDVADLERVIRAR